MYPVVERLRDFFWLTFIGLNNIMKNWLIIFALLCSLSACSGGSSEKQSTHADTATAQNSTAGYYNYQGTIAGQPVVLQLLKNESGNILSAAYYYSAHGRSIGLYWLADTTASNTYFVDEMPDTAGATQPRWKVNMDGTHIMGKWTSADGKKTFDINLEENYPTGTYRFKLFQKEEAIPFHQGREEPAATISWMYLLPTDEMEKPAADFISSTVFSTMGCDTLQATGMDDCMQKQKAAYAKFYRQSLEGMDDTMLSAPMNNYYSGTTMEVLYNADEWVSLGFGGSEYMGGAHGMYYSRYLNLDIRSKKIWQLADIMQVDSVRMTALLQKEAARYYATNDLETILLVDHIPATGNFFATHKGLTFHYDPYEVMPYAAGSVDLFIPYTSIKDLLTPAFKKRMNLN